MFFLEEVSGRLYHEARSPSLFFSVSFSSSVGQISYKVEKPRDLRKVYASCHALWDQILVSHWLHPGLVPVTAVELTLTVLQYLVKCKLGSLLKHCAYI